MDCPGCARSNRSDARFCDGCGRALAPGRGTRDVGAYTPRHLAEKILTQRSALEGERKQVTVLFVDVKSSLELAEEVDAEEWHRILDRFFHILSDGVHRFEGTVNQYTGDGIMALFGAPIAHEDHAQRACYAALHLARELRRYAQRLRREGGLDFHVRIGMNSGEVVVGRIGDDLRMDYTAQGHTVGLAARLEKLAEPGRAYLSEHTAALVSGYFDLEDLGEFKLRGISQAIRAFALEGLGALRTRFDVARQRGFSPFVGRRQELERLDAALERAAAGEGGAIAIVGDAGVGKSRLAFEFLQRCRERGVPVASCYGVSHGKAIPLLPVLEFLRDALEIRDEDDALRARRKIAGTLLLADREIADDLPLIFDLLGVADPAEPGPLIEGEGRERRVFAILRRVVQARSARGPSVVLFEDLQWFDTASQDFLAQLVRELSGTGTLLLLTYRPEFHSGLAAEPARVSLGPLGPEASEQLLGDLLGRDPALDSLALAIRERARGNPFFLEEVVQSLVEQGLLAGSRGAYRMTRSVEEIAIPRTVQALISARIDRLGERDKLLLDTAAVIGKSLSEPVLRHVSRLPDEELALGIQVLVSSEFLLEQGLYPERVLTFKHPLTQEVAYQSQLSDQRAPVHAAVARALEETDEGERLDEDAALIAHHWEQSGNGLAAARWVHRAARWIGPSNPAESMALWRKLLRLLEPAPRSPEISFLAARACRWLLFLGASQGMPAEEAARLYRTGRECSEQVRDRRSLALTLANYGFYQSQVIVDPKSSVECTREALRIAVASGRSGLELTIGVRLAQALGFWGRFLEATSLGQDLLARLGAEGAPEIDPLDHVTLYSTVGDALNEIGRPRQGVELIQRGLEVAARHGLTLNAGYCHNAYVRALALTGELAQADLHARAAMRSAERTGNVAMLVYALDVMGVAHQLNGRWSEAVGCGEQAVALSQRENVARNAENAHRAHLAHACLRAGDLPRAEEMAEAAVAASERCGPRYTPRAQIVLARVLLARDGLAARGRVEACLDNAQAAVDETEARIYEPVILEDWARLAELAGDTEQRTRLLRAAHERLLGMGLEVAAGRIERSLGAV